MSSYTVNKKHLSNKYLAIFTDSYAGEGHVYIMVRGANYTIKETKKLASELNRLAKKAEKKKK